MSDANARWSLVVSRDTDIALRQFLASQGGGRKGDLSRFVEDAVRNQIFDLTAAEAKLEGALEARHGHSVLFCPFLKDPKGHYAPLALAHP